MKKVQNLCSKRYIIHLSKNYKQSAMNMITITKPIICVVFSRVNQSQKDSRGEKVGSKESYHLSLHHLQLRLRGKFK